MVAHPPPTTLQTECWQCGGPADPEAAFVVKLVCYPDGLRDRTGVPASGPSRQEQIRVPIPRCKACRARNITAALAAFGGAAVGAAVVPSICTVAGLPMGPPGQGNAAVMVGVVLGFAAALLAVARRRRRLRLRPITAYPPIAALRERGWHWPSG